MVSNPLRLNGIKTLITAAFLIMAAIPAFAYTITSPFGWRTHPITGESNFHTGTDIAAESGTPIATIFDGKVVFTDFWGGYGNCVIVEHGNSIYSLYGHCSGFAIQAGETVTQGQIIAYVGSTGNSTGPHLHLEVWKNGEYIDPMTVLGGF